MPLVGGFGCLELCLYGIRELASAISRSNQSEDSLDGYRPMIYFLQARSPHRLGHPDLRLPEARHPEGPAGETTGEHQHLLQAGQQPRPGGAQAGLGGGHSLR